MIIEIGSYSFIGFYESIFNNSDDFLESENDLKDELKEKINKDIVFDVEYEYKDFNKYKSDVCNKFMEFYVDKIKDILPNYILDNKDFLFEKIDNSIVVVSPKYYNYESDSCYCDIETNQRTLELIKNHTLNLKGVNEYILKHFSSRDGFISFVSNDLDYWKSLDIMDYEQNMLISLLDMLLKLSDENSFNDINYDVLDCVEKYEYVEPLIYYKVDGGKYKHMNIDDFLKEYGNNS